MNRLQKLLERREEDGENNRKIFLRSEGKHRKIGKYERNRLGSQNLAAQSARPTYLSSWLYRWLHGPHGPHSRRRSHRPSFPRAAPARPPARGGRAAPRVTMPRRLRAWLQHSHLQSLQIELSASIWNATSC